MILNERANEPFHLRGTFGRLRRCRFCLSPAAMNEARPSDTVVLNAARIQSLILERIK